MSVESTVKSFTSQKAKVAYWKAKGLQNKQIALKLGDTFSEEDVENLLRVIYSDLGYKELPNNQKAAKLRNDVEPIMRRLVGSDTSKLEEFPLPTGSTEKSTESQTVRRPSDFKKWLLVPIALLLLCVLGVGAWAARNFLLPELQSAKTLRVGDELSDDRVTLKLIDVRWNELYNRVGAEIAPISHVFEYTNHSGETLVLQFDKTLFVIEDNTGRTAECWFFKSPYSFDEWNSTLNDNSTEIITTRCGEGRIPEGVTTYRLTIHPFTTLPESTWVVEVPR